MVTTARRLIQPVVDEFADDDKDGITRLLAAVQQLYGVLDANEKLLGPYLHSLAAAEIAGQQRQDLLPDWIRPRSMAQLIVALVNGVAISIAIDPAETEPSDVGSQFTQLLLAVRSPRP